MKTAENSREKAKLIHVINRLSFGPRPRDIETIQNIGIEAYIAAQLKPESIEESPQLTQRLDRLETLSMTPVELFKEYNPRRERRGERR